MIKLFKIIEKVVWSIAILAIVAALAMIFISAFANFDKNRVVWSSYVPYLYGAAAIVVLYKIIVLYFTYFYQTERGQVLDWKLQSNTCPSLIMVVCFFASVFVLKNTSL